APRAVAGEVFALERGEIGLDEALVVAIDRAHLAGPAVGDAEVAFGRTLELPALAVDDHRLHAEERPRRRARLQGRGARQRRDQDPAGLGLPPGVDDRD